MQEIYLVFGGDLDDPSTQDFADVSGLEVVGFFSSYGDALKAWQAASMRNIDDAFRGYRIVRLTPRPDRAPRPAEAPLAASA